MASKIHETAIIGLDVVLGEGVKVGAFSVIEGKTEIGPDTEIGSHCHLGIEAALSKDETLEIGAGSLIRSHSIFYAGSRFGPNLVTGHRVTVRENTIAGDNLQIGTLCDIQGHCTVGSFVRLHSNVHIGQGSEIGDFVWIFPYVVLTNDPHPPSNELVGCKIGDYAAIATMAVVLPGVEIESGALIGASTIVRNDVPRDTICVGNPGKNIGPTEKIRLTGGSEPAYPWRRHFHRGYPDHIVSKWKSEFGE